MKIEFEEHGKGKPVVLLHAFPLSRQMWSAQAEALKSENCRLILPDLRGFGENHSFSDINTMEDMAQDVADMLDTLKIERAIIGGLSMGGYIAFSFLKKFPEKIAALVLCDTNAASDSNETRENRFDLIEKIEKEGAPALIENLLPNLICENTKTNKKDLAQSLEDAFKKVNPKAAIAALRGMAERKDNTDLLDKISVPTLLVFGVEDKVSNLQTAEKMAHTIPNSSFVKIENAGHYSNLEQPEIFNRALVDFLKIVKI
ncbi:MAG TPA: alpha/beta hydrolase [Pyrinomonadaceae bacterium]|jgi:pimeloyl-ACP methyl ester carboxylesterase